MTRLPSSSNRSLRPLKPNDHLSISGRHQGRGVLDDEPRPNGLAVLADCISGGCNAPTRPMRASVAHRIIAFWADRASNYKMPRVMTPCARVSTQVLLLEKVVAYATELEPACATTPTVGATRFELATSASRTTLEFQDVMSN